MNCVEISLENHLKISWAKSAEKFAMQVLEILGHDCWTMGIVFTNDSGIQKYNYQWRGINQPTDVLSFSMQEGALVFPQPQEQTQIEAGDLLISLDTVRRNAQDWKNRFDQELKRVIVHGILHLMGMDHPGDDYSGDMLMLQESILKKLEGINLTGEHG